jgi:hypothetical protein
LFFFYFYNIFFNFHQSVLFFFITKIYISYFLIY